MLSHLLLFFVLADVIANLFYVIFMADLIAIFLADVYAIDKDTILKRSGVIYRFKCNRVEYDEEYIGESARNFGERYKEHQKSPSPIHDHITISGHTVSVEDFSIGKGRPKPPQNN